MKRVLVLGAVLAGGVIAARQLLSPERRASIRQGMMDCMMEEMPDESPPKLVMTILPRLLEQNDQILALLRAQSERGGTKE